VVLGLGLCAAVLMVATEFSTIQSVRVGDSTCGVFETAQQQDDCALTGGEQHSYALVLLGLLTAALAFGAGSPRARPAGPTRSSGSRARWRCWRASWRWRSTRRTDAPRRAARSVAGLQSPLNSSLEGGSGSSLVRVLGRIDP
jgi:hypothetical protein